VRTGMAGTASQKLFSRLPARVVGPLPGCICVSVISLHVFGNRRHCAVACPLYPPEADISKCLLRAYSGHQAMRDVSYP